jgi:hypothetical protein
MRVPTHTAADVNRWIEAETAERVRFIARSVARNDAGSGRLWSVGTLPCSPASTCCGH